MRLFVQAPARFLQSVDDRARVPNAGDAVSEIKRQGAIDRVVGIAERMNVHVPETRNKVAACRQHLAVVGCRKLCRGCYLDDRAVANDYRHTGLQTAVDYVDDGCLHDETISGPEGRSRSAARGEQQQAACELEGLEQDRSTS